MASYNKRFNGYGEYDEGEEFEDIWPGTTSEAFIPEPIPPPVDESSPYTEPPAPPYEPTSPFNPDINGLTDPDYGVEEDSGAYNLTPGDIEHLQGYEDFGSEFGGRFRDIAQNYPATEAGFSDLLRQMQEADLPFSEVGGSGSIQFGSDPENIADVMRNYRGGGEAWQFYPDNTLDQDAAAAAAEEAAALAAIEEAAALEEAKKAAAAEEAAALAAAAAGQERNRQTQDGNYETPTGITDDVFEPRIDIDPFGHTKVDRSSFPMYPPEYQENLTLRVGDDPLSQMQNLAAEGLFQGGGQVRTPLTDQTNQALSDLISSGGDLGLTPDEQQQRSILDQILEEGGGSAATPLEQETQDILRGLIDRGGRVLPDDQRRAMEIETARSPIDILRQSQLAEGRAAMAGRGLLGQGPEIEYGQRLEARLAPMYTQAAQQIQLDEATRADARYNTALEALSQQATFQRASADERYTQANQLRTSLTLDMATRQDDRLTNAINQSANLTQAQSQNLVSFINATTGVQEMRTTAALNVLDRNIAWNEFLANYDLDRAKFLELLDSGRFAEIAPLLNMMLQGIQTGAAGYRP